jgi:hypothetical protein
MKLRFEHYSTEQLADYDNLPRHLQDAVGIDASGLYEGFQFYYANKKDDGEFERTKDTQRNRQNIALRMRDARRKAEAYLQE